MLSLTAAFAQEGAQRRPPQPRPPAAGRNNNFRNQHLSQWMESHRNQPLSQQQNALAAEPGYRQLQPQEQQRIQNRLTQLNSMPDSERQRTIQRTEQMERLQPAQRQQIRSAMQQLGSLPDDRRRAVARTYRYLNALPPQQRQQYMNTPQYRGQFNESERQTMNNLITVSPFLPQTQPPGPSPQGQPQSPQIPR